MGGVSSTLGNQVNRIRSGNPGYIVGRPVVYGYTNTSNGTKINELVDGMTVSLPSTASISGDSRTTCPTSSDVVGKLPVSFGYDVSTGCGIELNRYLVAVITCTTRAVL